MSNPNWENPRSIDSDLEASGALRSGAAGRGMDHESALDLLPLYAVGSLDALASQSVEAHLIHCSECRADLALWLDTAAAVRDDVTRLPRVSDRVLASTLARIQADRRPSAAATLTRAATLVRAQLPLVRREIWLSSLLVMLLGYVVALLSGQGNRATSVIGALAPLVAAAGIAIVYGPDADPAIELALATPTSARQILLARLVVVFGYDLCLALVATVGLQPLVSPGPLGGIVLGWLGPMTFLSALALLLSLRLGAETAASVALGVWAARWISRGLVVQAAVTVDPGNALDSVARVIDSVSGSSSALLLLGAVLFAAAFWLVGRESGLSSRPAL